MRDPERRPVVLIVNEDLGFVCWLGEVLAQAGYYPVPALNSQEAVRLVAELKLPIDVAIVDRDLPGVDEAMATVMNRYPSLKMVARRDAAGAINNGSTRAGRFWSAQTARQYWLKSVNTALKSTRAAA